MNLQSAKHPIIFLFSLFLIFVSCCGTKAQISTENKLSTAQKWREDLRYLAAEMPKVHKNLFHKMTREQFETAVEKLDKQIPALNRNQIVVGLARIVAMVGDGHTRMGMVPNRLGIDEKIGFRQYPLKLYLYKDGLFVQSASSQYSDAVGGRVVEIGSFTAEQAFNTVSKIACRDNEMTVKDRTPYLMVVPEILQGLGLITDMEKARFVIEKDGKQKIFELKPAAKDASVDWIDVNPSKTAPLWLKDPKNNYWFEYLADSRTVYLQYNIVANKKEESFADFCKRLFAFADANPVDKFVIDLRHNEGGNSELNWSLIYGLIRSDKINQPGKLFTIIGRTTFSAAVNCADALERHTKTIFVGEPTGSSPNQYGDTSSIVLPNSGISVEVSTLWHQEAGARDSRLWLSPQIAADLTFEDYRANIDPALKAILNYVPEKSLADAMLEAFEKNETESAVKLYHDYKNNPVHAYADTENEINNFGYNLMNMNRFEPAIIVFKLNVESYPQSWNAYDSLGEAYLKSGNKALAIVNYKKSLELNPLNSGAKAVLRTLGEK